MNPFDKAIEFVLDHEGGYVNDPDDPGGETNYGISKKAYPDIDVKTLTKDAAKDIYLRDYWVANDCHKFHEKTGMAYFDACVNMGPSRATRILQKAAGVVVDGLLGPVTIAHSQYVNFERYNLYRMHTYCQLIRKNPKLSKFIGGWSNRVIELNKFLAG